MNANNSPYQDFIQLYLDNELSDAEQVQLFSEMSVNESLRKDFVVHFAMRDQLRRSLITPPVHLESAIVNAVQAPVTLAPTSSLLRVGLPAATLGAVLMLAFFWYGWKEPLDRAQTELESSLHQTAVLQSQLINKDNDIQSLRHQLDESSSIAEQAIGEAKSNRNEIDNLRASNRYNADMAQRRLLSLNSSQTEVQQLTQQLKDKSEQELRAQQLLRAAQMSNEKNIRDDQQQLAMSKVASTVTTSTIAASPSQSSLGSGTEAQSVFNDGNHGDGFALHDRSSANALVSSAERPWNFEIRALSLRSTLAISLPGIVNPPLNNYVFGINRRISDDWRVGLECGQENVLQQYTTIKNGITFSVDQNYLAFWVGAMADWSPSWLHTSDFQGFGTMVLGGTQVGPTGRLVLGARYELASVLSLQCGVESMALYARQESQPVWSLKYGLSGGINIHF